MVFIRKRLGRESGVVEAKYERKGESVGLEAYEAAVHEYYDHRKVVAILRGNTNLSPARA